jgi:hypothetical protein
MKTAVALDWVERHREQFSRVRVNEQTRTVQLALENGVLMEANERLRQNNADLMAAAEIWIRLYEAALWREQQAQSSLRQGMSR